jgi:hypothetical protein
VEGHRQKDENEGQTFTKSVNTKVLPDFLSVVFDPTRRKAGKVDLNGWYEYDDEGVKGKMFRAVDKGILKEFLMSRSPIKGFEQSNGHGRRQPGLEVVSRQSNLLVESTNAVSEARLRQMLLDEVKKQNKPYGLYFRDITGGFTTTQRAGLQPPEQVRRCERGHLRAPLCEGGGRVLHGLHDVLVSGAAAHVARERPPDLLLGGVRVLGEERHRGQHHPRRAEAALEPVLLVEGLLDGVEGAVLCEALDRRQLLPVGLDGEERARLHRLPVHEQRARPARGRIAADVRTGEAEHVPQVVHEEQSGLDVVPVLDPIDGHRRLHAIASSGCVGAIMSPARAPVEGSRG